MVSKRIAAAVAMVALSCGSVLMASDAPNPVLLDDTAPAAPAASGPTSLTPIMYLLDPTSVGKWMEANKLSVTGFVDAGYFYDTSAPRMGGGLQGDSPTFVSFPGGFSNRGVLDQLDLTVSKAIDSSKQWDYGFLFEAGYGIDDAQLHSYGVFDHRTGASTFNKSTSDEGVDPDNQFDIIQADVSLLVPIGSGLTITGGKFIGFFSYELINPLTNPFYTHSYSFFFGVPVTNTGVVGSYTFAKAVNGHDLTVIGGVTRGWNESTRDNNGAVDFLGEAKASVTDKLTVTVNFEEGPEAAQDTGNYWSTVEGLFSYAYSDQLTLGADLTYSDYPHGGTDADGGHDNAQWYGTALYAGYKINSNFTANLRTEWYRDQGGFSTGTQANYYEATVGVDIHPFPNDNILQFLQLRPELRQDWSDRPVYNANHNDSITPGDYTQFSVAMDVLMEF